MRTIPVLSLALVVAGCSSMRREETAPRIASARAEMRDLAGRAVGEVTLRQLPTGVLVVGQLTGMPPGAHAIHLHAVGRCEPPFETAGDHFRIGEVVHGFASARGPHQGDLPNIFVPESGTLRFETVSDRVTLGGDRGVLDADGAAVVVHTYADDYQTDPSGNSGSRIACGALTR
jgi:Cu-Zn family superoxide dismutase